MLVSPHLFFSAFFKESSPPDAVKIAWNYIGILIRENDNHIKSRERRFIIYSDTRKIDNIGEPGNEADSSGYERRC